ncbi:uncharacterized protein [Misgurnus anguillicaudatus]|uniref:uncharacterized protein n=2 Tax=Misgurnus anguillicaudatus TaxID=75329 RepID=UPI002435F231|nr:uncharacterized protein LOC129438270 [Misgurnus anguillicaudatus]XP_055052919.1 uncharacterized protein LOC129438270 [Misgurnus anguillicaudatus]
MSGLGEVLKHAILSVLPTLSPDVINQLVEKLVDQGVESVDDLVYVKDDDILEFLRPIQCRKLLCAWKNQENQNSTVVSLPVEVLPMASSETNSEIVSPQSSSSSTSICVSQSWPENFKVPWNIMPAGIQSAAKNGQRPSPADRRQMIRVLADEIRKHDLNPTRSQCATVTRKVVREYPKSFADMIGDRQIGGGNESLLSQLKVRIEHLNRNNTLSQRIQSSDSGTSRKRSSTDSYGCTRWQPSLPPGESSETLELKRLKMEEIYLHEGDSGAERGDVCKLMEETYCLQRHMINASPPPTIAELKKKWPYLFIQRHIYGHFELLTEKKVKRLLELSIQECGQIITQFFKGKPTNDDVRNILSKGENDVAANVLQLLLAHFKEKLDGIILQADEFATPHDVKQSLHLPGSPRLIILGESLSNKRWMLSMEGEIVCEGAQPCFVSGLAALFSLFYNFNLEYQDEAACTLEFVQRRFIDINPERGSKAKKGKVTSKKTGKVVQKKSCTMNPQVASLLRKLTDFEWDFV